MPTLNWIGKEKVINHHRDVPYRVLEHQYGFSDGQLSQTEPTASGNLIIHGDNLDALKSLLPKYEGKVDCIYIDPPYNTGNEGWQYNDNLKDPKTLKWLGSVVGKEGDDLSRHDKWLCMIYPRLKILHLLLSKEGSIFISIDDNEQTYLRIICDEIFGRINFVSQIIWQKKFAPQNDAKNFDANHEYILCYSKNLDLLKLNLLPRTLEMDNRYKNPDNDPRGVWTSDNPLRKEFREYANFPITTPAGRVVWPPTGNSWRFNKEDVPRLIKEGRLYFGKDGKGVPRIKRFLSEVKQGIIPQTLWLHSEVGHTQESKKEIINIFQKSLFETPKPTRLLKRILEIASSKNSIILDSFAGSGTTAHAVLNLNNEDGGNRKFILVEMEDYADTITAERVKRVISGYCEGINLTPGTGGAFDYYTLGEPLFLGENQEFLNESIPLPKIREYIWYSETRSEFIDPNISPMPSFLGKYNDTTYYFNYQSDSLTTLDFDFLAQISEKTGQYIIYADNCLLPADFMAKNNIVFKKIPRDISRF